MGRPFSSEAPCRAELEEQGAEECLGGGGPELQDGRWGLSILPPELGRTARSHLTFLRWPLGPSSAYPGRFKGSLGRLFHLLCRELTFPGRAARWSQRYPCAPYSPPGGRPCREGAVSRAPMSVGNGVMHVPRSGPRPSSSVRSPRLGPAGAGPQGRAGHRSGRGSPGRLCSVRCRRS